MAYQTIYWAYACLLWPSGSCVFWHGELASRVCVFLIACAPIVGHSTFNVTVPTYVEIEAEFDFVTGALKLLLRGRLPRGTIGRYSYETFFPTFAAGLELSILSRCTCIFFYKKMDVSKSSSLR